MVFSLGFGVAFMELHCLSTIRVDTGIDVAYMNML